MSSSHRGMPGCRQSLPPPIKHRAPASPSPTSSRSDAAISCVNFSLPHACSPAFAALHTVPFSYDKYEDQVDALAEKATEEFKKAVLHAKHLSKIPTGGLKDKKLH